MVGFDEKLHFKTSRPFSLLIYIIVKCVHCSTNRLTA